MKTQKGYILPIILIVILLGLAGFFLFSSNPVESPVVDEAPVIQATTTQTVTDTATNTNNEDIEGEEIEDDQIASTTLDIDVSISGQCQTDADCAGDEICYFKPSSTVGSCTEL